MTNDAAALAKFVVSIIVTVGFVACVFVLMAAKVELSGGAEKAFLILTGSLSTSFGLVVNYWLGSSAGSAAKTELLAAIANGAPR